MKKMLTNIVGEKKYFKIEEKKITVLTAHNGFGKTRINDKLSKSFEKYLKSQSFDYNYHFDKDWSYLLPTIYFWDFYDDFKRNLIFYFNIVEDIHDDKKGLWNKILYIFYKQISFKENHYSLGTTFKALNYYEIYKKVKKANYVNYDDKFFECYNKLINKLKYGISDENQNEIRYEVEIEYDIPISIDIKLDEGDIFIDQKEYLNEQKKEFKEEINDLINDIWDNFPDEYKEFHELRIFEFMLKNGEHLYEAKSNGKFDMLFPMISHILSFSLRINNNAVKMSNNEYQKFINYIEESPLRDVKIFKKEGGFVLVDSNKNYSKGELKWISNIIEIIKNNNKDVALAFDDPLDSMDSFYSNHFLKILEKSNIKRIVIFTHRSNVMRYFIQIKKINKFVFYNLFLNKIPNEILMMISTKSIIDIMKKYDAKSSLLLLIFFRFIFKNIKHANYYILSDAVKYFENKKNYTISLLKPVIIDLMGHKFWKKKFDKHKNEVIFDFTNEASSDISKIVNKIIWKKKNTSSYIDTMRHLSETEPLDIFLIDKKEFQA